MNDNPFRDIAEEVMEEAETVSEPEQETAKAETPSEQPPAEQVEAEEPETTFAEKVELKNRTPEELEEVYQNWQRSYTQKRQKETAELKKYREELETYKAKMAQQPSYAPTQQSQVDQVDVGNMSFEEYTNYLEQKAIEAASSQYEERRLVEFEQSNQERLYSDAISSDPRLDENNPEYDEHLFDRVRSILYDELNAHLEANGTSQGFEAAKIARELVEAEDKRLDEIIKKRTKQSVSAANARSAKIRKSSESGKNVSGSSLNKDSIKDILAQTLDDTA